MPPQVAQAIQAATDAQLHNQYRPTQAAIDLTRHPRSAELVRSWRFERCNHSVRGTGFIPQNEYTSHAGSNLTASFPNELGTAIKQDYSSVGAECIRRCDAGDQARESCIDCGF